ncbi:peptidoglycan DD-metalloendopeptidase family protein [Ruminococcaceae bacterium OttesenSCG-928-O06]|nr:peptidoglycan DD-metalloendopeptidase family protein [Ruminococcaceae bacterium OttesenSCG-928-O06]
MRQTKTPVRVLALLCMALVLLGAVTAPLAAETPQERYRRLQEELAETRELINGYKGDISAKQKLRAALLEEKALIDEMVELSHQEIARTEEELAKKQEEIAETRATLFDSDQLLRKRLVAIYDMNTFSTLTQVLNVDKFSELVTMVDSLQRISQHDVGLLQRLSAQKELLEAQQAEIDTALSELNEYYAQLLESQEALAQNIADLDGQISYSQALLYAQQQVQGDQMAALLAAQQEMAAIGGGLGGSKPGEGGYVGGSFIWPVPGFTNVSCEFGQPDPNGVAHRGMDISGGGANITGAAIVACGGGTVLVAGSAGNSYGNYVVLDHGDGIKTLYAHCESVLVAAGASVQQGDVIATVGSTGFVTGPHLHLEVQVGGALQNPRNYLP